MDKQNGEPENMNDKVHVTESNNNDKPVHPGRLAISNPADGIIQIRNILLGDLVVRWESKINKMEAGVRELIKKTEAKLAAMDEKMEQLDKELKEELETNLLELEQENDEMRSLIQSLKKELNEKISSLDENKLDKDSIADVFIQWGQRVKGN